MKTIALLIFLATINYAQNYGEWVEIDSMNIARIGHALVELPDGNVLVSGNGLDSIQSSAEIYDVSLNKWRNTSPMIVPRTAHKLVKLMTGKILAVGGVLEKSCEIFDPTTEKWEMTDSMPTNRTWIGDYTVTTLKDGRLFFAGGAALDTVSHQTIILDDADIYDPLQEKWIEVAPMKTGRIQHTATLLMNGKVLITGGFTEDLQTAECEIYDPISDSWTTVTQMMEKRWNHAAILLNSGAVFVSGGNPIAPWLKSCEVYDVKEDRWYRAEDMLAYRTGHVIYYIKDLDKLFILGGDAQPMTTEDTWEIYDPNNLKPVYLEPFPINQFLVGNNIQLRDGNVFLAGEEEYELPPGGLPFSWATNKTWIFDIVTGVSDNDNSKIVHFSLKQNYPNPFGKNLGGDGITQISYSLSEKGYIKLEVYDALGKVVSTVTDNWQDKGEYNVFFNAEHLSSGVYFYSLSFTNSKGILYSLTKKMIITR